MLIIINGEDILVELDYPLSRGELTNRIKVSTMEKQCH